MYNKIITKFEAKIKRYHKVKLQTPRAFALCININAAIPQIIFLSRARRQPRGPPSLTLAVARSRYRIQRSTISPHLYVLHSNTRIYINIITCIFNIRNESHTLSPHSFSVFGTALFFIDDGDDMRTHSIMSGCTRRH